MARSWVFPAGLGNPGKIPINLGNLPKILDCLDFLGRFRCRRYPGMILRVLLASIFHVIFPIENTSTTRAQERRSRHKRVASTKIIQFWRLFSVLPPPPIFNGKLVQTLKKELNKTRNLHFKFISSVIIWN